MEEKLIKLALDSGVLNYIDCETPRRYFISGNADLEELTDFAELIIKEYTKNPIYVVLGVNRYGSPYLVDTYNTEEMAKEQVDALRYLGYDQVNYEILYL